MGAAGESPEEKPEVRAVETMKESLGLYIFILAAWMSVSTYWYTCRIRNLCIPEEFMFKEGAILSAGPSALNLSITGTNISVADNIKFLHSRQHPMITGRIKLAFNDMETFLSLNDDLALEISGAYAAGEKNHSLLDNLGQARAEAFKAWLVKQGCSRSQLITRFVKKDNLAFNRDTLRNGLTFRVIDMPEKEGISVEELQAIGKRLRENNQPLYFADNPSAYALSINNDLRDYIRDLRVFLNANPDRMITLVGYTDESGSAETNVRIGRMRAEYVRQMLSEAGVNYYQMRTNSKGEKVPVASSDIREEQYKNCRVEIKF